MEEEITAGISDADSRVRVAAAQALFRMFESERQRARNSSRPNVGYAPAYASPSRLMPSPTPSFFGGVAKILGEMAKKAAPTPPPVVEEKKATESGESQKSEGQPTEEKPSLEVQPPPPSVEVDPAKVKPSLEVQPPPPPSEAETSVKEKSSWKQDDTARPVGVPPNIPPSPGVQTLRVEGNLVLDATPLQEPGLAPTSPLPALSPNVTYESAPAMPAEIAPSDESQPNPTAKDEWLQGFYDGKTRPEWTKKLIEPLTKMLSAESLDERVAAAMAIIPMGKADAAVPVLLAAAKEKPEIFSSVAEVLPWLVRDKRLALFRDLRALDAGTGQMATLLSGMSQAQDPRDEDLFWEVLAEKDLATDLMGQVYASLQQVYSINRGFSTSSGSPASGRTDSAKAKKLLPRTSTGTESQRLVALSLLAATDNEEALKAASQMTDDSMLSEELRRDAFQIKLLLQPDAKSRNELAVDVLKQSDPSRSKIALKVLVGGVSGLGYLRERIFLSVSVYGDDSESRSSGQPIVPQPPKGLKLDDIKPLMEDSNEEIAAYAGYLTALFADPVGMEPLLKYWRQQNKQNSTISTLVYRAAAVLDDPKYLPELREIYGKMQEYELGRFYWTIRIMTGPEILKFRKEIRDKHGMSKLQ
jgi:hypothetical protein